MRLQMILAALLLAKGGAASADKRAATWAEVYSDSDRVTVYSQQVTVRSDVHESLEVDAGYDVDVISAASVDVVSSASPRGYDEVRHGLTVGGRYKGKKGLGIALHYLPTWEPDYTSHSVALGGAREWLDRRLTTRLDYRLTLDSVGRKGDESRYWRPLTIHAAGVGLGIVVGPQTVVDLAYEVQAREGFQASPYRYVSIFQTASESPPVSLPEAVPDGRVTQALGGRVRHAFSTRWFALAAYRFYFDDWGVRSHTFTLGAQHAAFTDRLVLGATVRGYQQSAARFHEARYVAPDGFVPAFRVVDKMLAPSWSLLASALAECRFGPLGPIERLWLTAKLSLLEQHFSDFPRLSLRRAFIGAFGASVEF
jgi:hypothetical protein